MEKRIKKKTRGFIWLLVIVAYGLAMKPLLKVIGDKVNESIGIGTIFNYGLILFIYCGLFSIVLFGALNFEGYNKLKTSPKKNQVRKIIGFAFILHYMYFVIAIMIVVPVMILIAFHNKNLSNLTNSVPFLVWSIGTAIICYFSEPVMNKSIAEIEIKGGEVPKLIKVLFEVRTMRIIVYMIYIITYATTIIKFSFNASFSSPLNEAMITFVAIDGLMQAIKSKKKIFFNIK